MSRFSRPPAPPAPPTPKVGESLDGVEVFERYNSHSHVDPALLREALAKIDLSASPQFLVTAVPMGRVVGETRLVPTTPADEIVFAVRPPRNGATRFVKGRSPRPYDKITVVLKDRDGDGYILITAFVGDPTPPEPFDPKADANALAFWENHALTWDESEGLIPLPR